MSSIATSSVSLRNTKLNSRTTGTSQDFTKTTTLDCPQISTLQHNSGSRSCSDRLAHSNVKFH
ncbi:hypothetical protein FA13DRAFT_102469 [Coprinellus micaceus]|uniref:Uncharacterized protein n=1 Tax=Coprinellus micaceus TaxID=71717 RepID=A0A4Y7THM2_COPMI|nr:hypothetical protein FA13DRAFT_102469 [Coprinellus micaceus]